MKKTPIFNNKKILYLVIGVLFLLIGISAFVSGYYLANLNNTSKKETNKSPQKALKELQKLVDENIELNNTKTNKVKITKEKNTTKKLSKVIPSESLDYKNNSKNTTKKHISQPKIKTNKPKLVIIMDDMSFGYEVRALKHLNLVITPSFFPPTKVHPNTPKYAKEFKHFMIHFPMQAMNQNFKEEPNTLHINSSNQFIINRIKFIKQNFPNVKFVNNHTGSKFTSNLPAMQKLFRDLKKYNIIFIDSRTISSSKAPIIAKEYHQLLLSRDVFLDNEQNVKYIKHQIRDAIRIAKKRGYAIAICHPHKTTFLALKQSKKMLKQVDMVYIDELYKLVKQHKISKF